MGTNELTRVDALFDSVPLIHSSKHLTTENGVSAKSWYPLDNSEMSKNKWQCNEMNVTLYSTGLCKMTFSSISEFKVYNWLLRVVDEFNNQLLTISFSPMIIERVKPKDYRIFKVERRFSEVDEALINKAHSIQVINN